MILRRSVKESHQAEFFDSDHELLQKSNISVNPTERASVATARYKRCLQSGYSNEAQLKGAL